MALKKAKPTSAGQRFRVQSVRKDLHKGGPRRALVRKKSATGGRNNAGRITTRQRGGGHKRRYRVIDFKRDKDGVPGRVEHLEYDPNRSAHLALVLYADGERRYIIAPRGVQAGSSVISGETAPTAPGNAMPLKSIRVGTQIHCVELRPGKGAQLCRSAGSAAQLVAREGAYATLRLRSSEMRRVHVSCRATIGEVGNNEHSLQVLGKAGARRWRGERPTVRGIAMNPVDHPHGGGEGTTAGGRHPVSPWGKKTKGAKTRRNKATNSMVVRPRSKR
jgi:large subunit ribosomal protein L2